MVTFTSFFVVLPVNHSKARLVVFVKLFLNFGHSAAPNPDNHVAALVLYGTRGSVRDLDRCEHKYLPLSPKANAKRHRWRENSYGLKLTNAWRSNIFSVLF